MGAGAGAAAGTIGSAALSNSGVFVLDRNEGTSNNNYTFSNAVSGSGSIVFTGSDYYYPSGANTYTGNTVVKAGTLIITTSSGQGNYSVSNNAALGVTVATSGCAKALSMSALCGVPLVAVMVSTGAAVLVKLKSAGVDTPVAVAATV